MKRTLINIISLLTLIALIASVAGCSSAQTSPGNSTSTPTTATTVITGNTAAANPESPDTAELLSNRDLEQTADLSAATQLTLESGTDVTLSIAGIYVLQGNVADVTIVIEAPDDAKIQLVLDGVSISNTASPAIYVKTADKVFITTTNSENTMSVSGSYTADGETNLDAVIFSKADLTLNGLGLLQIQSARSNGIVSKDDLVITGGTYEIQAAADGLEAQDALLISNGTLSINSGKDALHCENAEDASLGYILISGGTIDITAADDAIRGNSRVRIDGGTINITSCTEGIEANFITINNGQITLFARDDGINATQKVSGEVGIVVNGGSINMSIGSGDTDGFDSNGTITINGGTINIEAVSAFDSNGTATLNGGDVTVNGTKITQIIQTQPGGGPGGGGRPRR